jgi:putative ABC transport system permease protein
MLSWFSQTVAVTLVNLRSMPQRTAASVVTTIGIAGVVVVLVSVLSFAQGFRIAMTSAGDSRTAIVMRAGSPSETSSVVERDDVSVIKDAPQILREPGGPVASAEVYVIVNLAKRSTGTSAHVPLRGVELTAFAVRDEVRIVEGRRFEPGRSEIIVGRAAARQFDGVDVGRTVRWGANTWTIVGLFEAGGGISESELWCDVGVLQPAYRLGRIFHAVYVKLESSDAFARFTDVLMRDPRLGVMVVRESDYLAQQSASTTQLITTLGFGIALLMAIGAIFGAVNTMYNAVAVRTREIATLRTLGFGGGPVVLSVLAESLLLALVGGVLGGAAAWAVFDGYQTATLNQQTFTQVSFVFAVTAQLLVEGALCALVIGLVGGVFPAIHAAWRPVTSGLREF